VARTQPNGNEPQRAGRIRSMAMRALSDLVARSRFASKIGATFGGQRDMECALGYQERLAYEDFRHRYRRGGIAKRLVEAFPQATWQEGPSLVEDPQPDMDTEFELAFASLVDRLKVWSKFRRADVLAGVGEYSVLLIGVEGEPDLTQPLPKNLSGPDSVLYLTPISQNHAEVDAYVTDPSDARFGLPEFYQLTLGASRSALGAKAKTATVAKRCHWSRVIHFVDEPVEDEVFGTPRLQAAWNYLDDLTKVVGGGAEAAWKRAQPWLQLDMDPEVEMPDDVEDAMDDEVDELLHGLRTVFRTRGVKANLLAASVSSFQPNVDAVLKLLSSTSRIPLRLLVGSERGELASSEDRNSWSDQVSARQTDFATPIVREFVDRLIEHGALPEPATYEPVWPDTQELNEEEKAGVTSVLATANKAQFEAEGRVIIMAKEIRDKILGLDPVEEVEGDDGGEAGEVVGAVEQLRATKRRIMARRALAFEFVDRAPDSSDWRAVHRAADSNRARIEGVVGRMLTLARDSVDVEELRAAYEARDAVRVEAIVSAAVARAGEAADESIADALIATLAAGGEATARSAASRGDWMGGEES